MIVLTVDFDTQLFSREDYKAIADSGVLLSATKLLNRRWDEFSALEAARTVGLTNVTWEAVWDDTPGTLTCVFLCETLLPEPLSAPSVWEWQAD